MTVRTLPVLAVAVLATGVLTACGGAPSPAGTLIARIHGCGQVQTWGGNSLFNSVSNGECWLADGTQLRVSTWAAGDTADQATYANSPPLLGTGPCVITGGNPVPWVVTADVSDDAPADATAVQRQITSDLGGSSAGGPACTGQSAASVQPGTGDQ